MAKAILAGLGDAEDEETNFNLQEYAENPFQSEEANYMKRFVSKYFKDGTISVLGRKEDDYITWMDLSYMLPHSTITDPAQLILKGVLDPQTGFGTAFQKASAKFMAPYFSEQMWVSALRESQKESETLTGALDPNPMWRSLMSGGAKMSKIVIPGTLTDWEKLRKAAAAGGTHYKYGSQVSFKSELFAQLVGTKIVRTNIPYQYERNLNRWSMSSSEAMRPFTSLVKDRTTVDTNRLEREWKRAVMLDRQAFVEMRRDYLAAKALESTKGETDRILDGHKNISKDLKARIKSGVWRTPRVSSTTIQRAMAAERATNNVGRVEFLKEKMSNVREEYIYPED